MAEGDYTSSVTISSSTMGCSTGYVDYNTHTDANTIWRVDNGGDSWGTWRRGTESPSTKLEIKELPKKIEGVEMKQLFDVYLVYAEDRKKPIVHNRFGVIANGEEDAKIKSGLWKLVDEEWDEDYLTFIVKKIGDVKVKERPKEVKTVK